MNLLMAVLEKRVGLQLGGCDAYVNLAGGMKLGEPAIDLGIIMAIASSYKNRPILEDTIIFGEVGLVGEVRAVSGGEARIKEAQKLGFKRCILPQANVDQIKVQTDMRLVGVSNVMEALDLIAKGKDYLYFTMIQKLYDCKCIRRYIIIRDRKELYGGRHGRNDF